MKFTEAKLEHAFIELLKEEGYKHILGETIIRMPEEVLIEADLKLFLQRQYVNEGITQHEIESIILQLKTYPSSDLYESNKTIMKMVSDGFILKREDRSKKDIYIQLIDYNGLSEQSVSTSSQLTTVLGEEKPKYGDKNIYKVVNQLEIFGNEKRIPDAIVYVNGLPLAVFEFKSAIREEATIFDAFNQLTIRYKRDIPELFKYNAFCVISDGVNNKAGSFFAPY